jgi:uncharacterized protein
MNQNYHLHFGFSLMAKPSGSACNLNCTYCFYLEKQKLYKGDTHFKMNDEVLETYVKAYINSQSSPVVSFAWQGGEPLLAGIGFYEKAVILQGKYRGKRKIENVLQTNGTLLNEDWCNFLKENNFLVGISIDGPEEFHDKYRLYKNGTASFKQVMQAIELLHKYSVPFNTLTVVNRNNAEHPEEVYSFLKSTGSTYLQFIPVVERYSNDEKRLLRADEHLQEKVTEWSVLPQNYGSFLCSIFDKWIKNDVGKIFVQTFDATLANWFGVHPGLCALNATCGDALIIEHNGDVYACDHFVFPEYLRGNILKQTLPQMVSSLAQSSFGTDKTNNLPDYCLRCEYRFACHGECPKYRFTCTPDGEPGLNYLCEGYLQFFRHVHPYMQYMADMIKARRPPSDIMQWIRNR